VSSSSSTTPASSPRNAAAPPSGPPSRSRTIFTWVLLVIWALLLTFGVVAMGNPAWLERLAKEGQQGEVDAFRHLGDNELKKGRHALAIAQYNRALAIRPDQPAVYLNLGIAYLALRDVARGEAALLQASRLETTARMRPFIAMHLGEAAEMQGRQPEAIRFYDQALQEGGRRDLVYQKLGAVYLAQKDYQGAGQAFTKALEAQTDPLLAYEKMLERTQEAAEQDSTLRRWLESGGTRTLSEADWDRYDRESIAIMLSQDREIAKTHNHLGLIAHLLGDRAGAIRHFEQSLAIWPENPDASRNLRILRTGSG
jgi:tetratricopeptide (TPR) repeat protein